MNFCPGMGPILRNYTKTDISLKESASKNVVVENMFSFVGGGVGGGCRTHRVNPVL